MGRCVEKERATEPGPPFRFNRDDCIETQGAFTGAQIGKLFLCNCRQDTFDVILGRVLFVTAASPLGSEKEVRFLQECGKNFLPQLRKVCRESTKDFNLLARQLIQVCCKRVRVPFDEQKFECRAAVPDDVTEFEAVF